MAYSVLILDDDADFNSLLSDVFEQADYVVTSIEDPLEAIEVFANVDYDLVVTDYKMPEMSGAEFITAIKKIRPEVPAIMVSGYLDNDTIRDLIREGVGGVFLKPLNIFSLLERTAELIEEARKAQKASGSAAAAEEFPVDSVDSKVSSLGFNFRSFPCKSQASIDFAERLYHLRHFKSTLSLIGEPGTQFDLICADICGFYQNSVEHFIYLSADSFDCEQVFSMLEAAQTAGAERVTCVLLSVEQMSAEQKVLAVALSKHSGAFDVVPAEMRTIFCVSGDLDVLFDAGLIDETLYILMGTAEVRVPALRDCPVDIAVIAQQMVVYLVRKSGGTSVPRFDQEARGYLRKQAWENNYEELRSVIEKVMKKHSGDTLTLAALISSVHVGEEASPRARFDMYLSRARVDYVRAASILLGGDRVARAAFFASNPDAVEAVLK